jgi:hypothetical protein
VISSEAGERKNVSPTECTENADKRIISKGWPWAKDLEELYFSVNSACSSEAGERKNVSLTECTENAEVKINWEERSLD